MYLLSRLVQRPQCLYDCLTELRTYSVKALQSHTSGDELSYRSWLAKKLQEARRCAVIITSCKAQGLEELLESYGPVKSLSAFPRDDKHFVLVEYGKREGLDNLLRDTEYFQDKGRIASRTRCLFYTSPSGRLQASGTSHLTMIKHPPPSASPDIFCQLTNAKSLCEQIEMVANSYSLSESSRRFRFTLSSILEEMIQRVVPFSTLTPFGSSVTGLGLYDCDVDLVLDPTGLSPPSSSGKKKRMLFLSKQKKAEAEGILRLVGELVHHVQPQFHNVRQILSARVPIVKCTHTGSDIEADISVSNNGSDLMSELLFDLGRVEPRFTKLVTVLRLWAQHVEVTGLTIRGNLSNFMLTALVIHYLQGGVTPPVLPSLNDVQTASGPVKDYHLSTDATFSMPHHWINIARSANTQSLDDLLTGFFQYYSRFDFTTQGICLHNATTFSLPAPLDHADPPYCLFIPYPMDPSYNICKNVEMDRLEHFVSECRRSSDLLSAGVVEGEVCGLLPLLGWHRTSSSAPANVTHLFVKSNTKVTPDHATTLETSVQPKIAAFSKESVLHRSS